MSLNIKHFFLQIKEILTVIYLPARISFSYFIVNLFFFLTIQTNKYFPTRVVFYAIYHILLFSMIFFLVRTISNEEVSTLSYFRKIQPSKIKYRNTNLNLYTFFEIREKEKVYTQFCKKCETFKPPRAHHCEKCNVCFFRMDHHCDLLATCIHFHNQKFFIIFLANMLIFNILNFTFLMIALLLFKYQVIILICLIFDGIDVFGYFIQIYIQLKNLFRNETIIESVALDDILSGYIAMENIFQEGLIAEQCFSKEREILNPYNIGRKKNFEEIFGKNKFKWYSLEFTTKGDGIHFPKNKEN